MNSPYPRPSVSDSAWEEQQWLKYRNQVLFISSLFAVFTYAAAFVFGYPGVLLCIVCNGIWLIANIVWIPLMAFTPRATTLRSTGRALLLLTWHLATVILQIYTLGPLS